jgi:hypothetical protein
MIGNNKLNLICENISREIDKDLDIINILYYKRFFENTTYIPKPIGQALKE